MDPIKRQQARLTGQALGLTSAGVSLAGISWTLGPYQSPVAVLLCVVMLGCLGFAGLLVHAGRVRPAAVLATGAITALSIAGVSIFWGIEEHNAIMLVPSILIAGLLLGPRGVLAVAATVLAYIAVELAWGPPTWVEPRSPYRTERALDLSIAFLLIGFLVAMIVTHYRRFLSISHGRQRALEQEEAFRGALVQQAPTPMLVVGPDGTLQQVNVAAIQLLGVDAVGLPVEQVLTGAGGQGQLAAVEGAIPVEYAEAFLDTDEGVHRMLVLHDLRPQREMVARQQEAMGAVEQASRAKSVFLATMSHELRTPLTAIIGYGEMLGEETDDPDAQHDLDRILSSGRHLLELIDDVLDMSRVEAGKLELSCEAVPMETILAEIDGALAPSASRRGLTLVVDGGRGLVLHTDRLRVRQILLNLASNAVKFARRRVVVRCRSEGDAVWFDVDDDGPGINAELGARLFQPFARGTADASGTGLGLALSRQIARRLGGETSLVSTSPNGTRFRLKLPADQAAVGQAMPLSAEGPPRCAQGAQAHPTGA